MHLILYTQHSTHWNISTSNLICHWNKSRRVVIYSLALIGWIGYLCWRYWYIFIKCQGWYLVPFPVVVSISCKLCINFNIFFPPRDFGSRLLSKHKLTIEANSGSEKKLWYLVEREIPANNGFVVQWKIFNHFSWTNVFSEFLFSPLMFSIEYFLYCPGVSDNSWFFSPWRKVILRRDFWILILNYFKCFKNKVQSILKENYLL